MTGAVDAGLRIVLLKGADKSPLKTHASSVSRSAKSCGRPTARLLRIRAFLLRTKTGMPSSSAGILVANASSLGTPLMLVSKSIRLGGRPS